MAIPPLLCYPGLPLAFQDEPSQAAFSGIDGFLGTRGSFMMDLVVLAMFAILPLLALSIWTVKRGKYRLHKRLQLVMGGVLLVAVALFEVDIQFLSVWEERAEPSPYFSQDQAWSCPAGLALLIHLCFAVPTLVLWIAVIVRALVKFSSPPLPGPHSRAHTFWSWPASVGMLLTAATGWVFYGLAFVAG